MTIFLTAEAFLETTSYLKSSFSHKVMSQGQVQLLHCSGRAMGLLHHHQPLVDNSVMIRNVRKEPYFDYNRVYFVSPEGLAEHHSSFIHEVENQSKLVPVAPLASSSPIDMAGLQQMEPSSTASTQPSCALISCDEFIVDQVGLILVLGFSQDLM